MDNFGKNRQQQFQNNTDFNFNDLNQVRQLINKLNPEERQKVSTILRSCAGEMTLMRGIPISLFVFGGFHFMRNKLPKHLQAGPQSWVLKGLLISGSLMLSNILFRNSCFDRLKPTLQDYYLKYEANVGNSRYAQLREAHRNQQSFDYTTAPVVTYTSAPTDEYKTPSTSDNQPPKSRSIYNAPGSYYMSGTPTRSPNSLMPTDSSALPADNQYLSPNSSSKSKNTYGDEGFS